jgi:SAM-dependent methyltransferase
LSSQATQSRIREEVAALAPPDPVVLDAGCGGWTPVPAGRLVGIDISPASLRRHPGLDEAIVGDIQSHPLPPGAFDVVVCWNVLEHLPRPGDALANLARAVKPGGALVVGVPNVYSPKGLLAKLTPHAFHVWVYRRLLREKTAGLPGHRPFRTHLRLAISPRALSSSASRLGLRLRWDACYEADSPRYVRQMNLLTRLGWRLLELVWPGDPKLTDYAAVFVADGREALENPPREDGGGRSHPPRAGMAARARRRLAEWSVRSESVSRWRERRYRLFLEACAVRPDEAILDVGAGLGRALARYNKNNPIVAVDRVRHTYAESWFGPNVTFVEADALELPFADRAFPVAFSNSVIEHVGDQERFAREIRRVADRYFVQTPNRWFPIEPHYQMPFIQFLPERAVRWLNSRFDMGHRPRGYWEPVRLLSARDLQRHFPDAVILRERLFGLTKSLIAVRPQPSALREVETRGLTKS